jgi:plasmid maintenance system antidote protein VapI
LRDAYDRRFRAGEETQTTLAKKLDIDRSAVHRRLMGRTNMTTETIADMVWALDCKIGVKIQDARQDKDSNYSISPDHSKPPEVKINTGTSQGVAILARNKIYSEAP